MGLFIYDIMFIIAFIFFLIMVVSMCMSNGKIHFTSAGNIDIYNDALYRRKVWLHASITWLAVHYFITLSTFLSTIIVIYISVLEETNRGKIFFYSIISLFSSVITYVVHPDKASLAYRKAYRLIDDALLNKRNLEETIKTCETIISKGHK